MVNFQALMAIVTERTSKKQYIKSAKLHIGTKRALLSHGMLGRVWGIYP